MQKQALFHSNMCKNQQKYAQNEPYNNDEPDTDSDTSMQKLFFLIVPKAHDCKQFYFPLRAMHEADSLRRSGIPAKGNAIFPSRSLRLCIALF
jgi:hypothetical protein